MRPLSPSFLVHSSSTTITTATPSSQRDNPKAKHNTATAPTTSTTTTTADGSDEPAPPKPHSFLIPSRGGHASAQPTESTTPMEGVISISTAASSSSSQPPLSPTPATTTDGHHYDSNRQSPPSPLGKNGERKALSETANGKHSSQDIIIHSPSPSPSSPFKSKHTNGSITRFNLPDETDKHEDSHDHDDHESHSGMELDTHQQISDEKYKSLKRTLKVALEDNERMSQELDKFHRRVRHLRREKNLLLDRLCTLERQGSDSGSDSLSSLSSDSESSDSSLSDHSRHLHRTPSRQAPGGKGNGNKGGRGSGAGHTASHSTASTATATSPQSKKVAAKGAARRSSPSAATASSARSGPKEPKPQPPAAIPSTITNVGSATQKPKRVHQTNKQRAGLAKARKVQILERDEQGNVKLPVTVGIITILNIGYVVYDREAFHNDRYIWPVGYKMSRSYNSMIDPNTQTTYTCSVIDDGEAPKFQIDAEDQPGKPIIAGTATGAWTHIVKAANAIRKRDHSNSASGPDYFGFSNATIAKMIQDLPNADKCSTYVMQQFEEITGSGGSGVSGGQTGGASGKRKVSALASSAKSGKNQDDDQDGGEDGGGDAGGEVDDDDDEEYTTLGSLNKPSTSSNAPLIFTQKKTKKTKVAALPLVVPAIRLAGVNDFGTVSSSTPPTAAGSSSVKGAYIGDGGDDTVSEAGSPPRDGKQHQQQSNGTSAPHSITAATALESSTDQEAIDVDIDIEGDEEMQDRPRTSLSPAGRNGGWASQVDEGMTTDEEDLPLRSA